MNWKGKWRNQYGSVVEITDDAGNRIAGTFRTALADSGFYGQTVPVVGVHQGDCISFVCGGTTPVGDSVVSYTGLVRNGKMETFGSSRPMPPSRPRSASLAKSRRRIGGGR
jgi:hypothetical protein